jgi:hypothetical protein
MVLATVIMIVNYDRKTFIVQDTGYYGMELITTIKMFIEHAPAHSGRFSITPI